MLTTYATISDLRITQTKVWIELKVLGKYFPVNHEFDTALWRDYSKVAFILDITRVKKLGDIKNKGVRVIVTEAINDSLIAIGDPLKNRFIDLQGDEFPVSERRINWRYRKKA